MSDSKTFHGVTQGIFNCLRTKSEQQHGTVYDPPDANSGKTTTKGTGWTVVLKFNFNPGNGDLFYEVEQKSWIVPISAVWSGISDTINSCRQQ